ncbi:hypothetical protein [Paenibacillus apiarius]|uniref:Uncharacterized protein n=1 Tax=Paenibacillus apiarius TaxID=46240 RepID=A0ABT4DNA9_9BACL|nr:hypothetical protein [Paenibacillus apiarius]MBN3524070.1 hypothetical protein [Paenibacillus apiarius]MCY9515436.1 hypothetical protein [Paenibacillus apiarius]MCY9518845.1 hypothetical protein [Paenibacillus apiarius]MCY9552108.1 hypothetical protein [Paenibacillus apiarius]MCY9557216.1 hypothetical protein [Paenibacillus apiarius]
MNGALRRVKIPNEGRKQVNVEAKRMEKGMNELLVRKGILYGEDVLRKYAILFA